MEPSEIIARPSDSTFPSFQEAYDALKKHGIENGYGFYLKQSRPFYAVVRTRFYYRCDKSRQYQSTASVRKTGSRTTGCPFSVIIGQDCDQDQWRLQVQNGSHNHIPSLNPSAHHVFRKRSEAQKELINSMTKAGSAPKQIFTAIRQEDPNTFIACEDIRNDRVSTRARELGPRTPIEALLDTISTDEWVFSVKTDSENRVQYLFFAHQKQVELLRANPDVLMMDCTYRTNKYKYPLLHILGSTNLNTFFSAGFCFMRNESSKTKSIY
jgi:hypothetical protein